MNKWELKPDLFFFKEPEEQEKEQAVLLEAARRQVDEHGSRTAVEEATAASAILVVAGATLPQIIQANGCNEDEPRPPLRKHLSMLICLED